MNSLFRLQAPSAADLDSFHQDGYISIQTYSKKKHGIA